MDNEEVKGRLEITFLSLKRIFMKLLSSLVV